jgi:hypothetical protein
MTATTRLVLLVLGLGLILCSALASEYPFGTKVLPTDSDFGRPLRVYALPNPPVTFSIGYWETNVVAGYDDTDVVYLHQGPAIGVGGIVTANDVRLTPFGYLPAGSKVTPQDNDIGMLLGLLPWVPPGGVPASIGYINLYGGPGNDLDDPVYIHQATVAAGIPLITNDVRLTAIGGNGPGTKVGNLDPDMSSVFALFTATSPNPITILPTPGYLAPAGPASPIRYVDINGNFQYDYPDDVYLLPRLPRVATESVSVNDIRLSGSY